MNSSLAVQHVQVSKLLFETTLSYINNYLIINENRRQEKRRDKIRSFNLISSKDKNHKDSPKTFIHIACNSNSYQCIFNQ